MTPSRPSEQSLSSRRRQALEEKVSGWTEKLQRQLAEAARRKERHEGTRMWDYFGERWEAETLETLSIWDLVRRGLEPNDSRRFRGRVSLTIRCAGKGHLLARVYPTCALPVLVPAARGLPLVKENRQKSEREMASLKKIFGHAPFDTRDPWIEEFDYRNDDDEMSDPHDHFFGIRGIAALTDQCREVESEFEGRWVYWAFFLVCRCGQLCAPRHIVMEALDAGETTLTV